MRRMLPRSRRIEIAQAAERRGADIAPENDYGTPNCRFVTICRMMRGGASDNEIKYLYPEMDSVTLAIYRRHVSGELTEGRETKWGCPVADILTDRDSPPRDGSKRMSAWMLFDRGSDSVNVAYQLGIKLSTARQYRNEWRRWKQSQGEVVE